MLKATIRSNNVSPSLPNVDILGPTHLPIYPTFATPNPQANPVKKSELRLPGRKIRLLKIKKKMKKGELLVAEFG